VNGSQVTVVIPYHAERKRNGMLERALTSVARQTVPHIGIATEDTAGQGAAATRQRGLETVTTEWVAFLDSDDEMDPTHLEQLLSCARDTGADYAYSHYRVAGGTDPRPWMLGRPWSDDDPQQTTITVVVRTDLAQRVGFHAPGDLTSPDRLYAGEDWAFTTGCMNAGARIVHHPHVTWTWHHHGANSSGLPGRGDARRR
jgi:glycosyltransferase involved in cell wall biosynthesis